MGWSTDTLFPIILLKVFRFVVVQVCAVNREVGRRFQRDASEPWEFFLVKILWQFL